MENSFGQISALVIGFALFLIVIILKKRFRYIENTTRKSLPMDKNFPSELVNLRSLIESNGSSARQAIVEKYLKTYSVVFSM